MSSGYFPLLKDSDSAKKLMEAQKLISEVVGDLVGDIYTQDQVDNAAQDGGSLALLNLAIQILKDEVS